MKTPNGENPLVHGGTPILGVDVWEHSYYIDYRNARPKYLEAFVDNLINWDYVLEAVRGSDGLMAADHPAKPRTQPGLCSLALTQCHPRDVTSSRKRDSTSALRMPHSAVAGRFQPAQQPEEDTREEDLIALPSCAMSAVAAHRPPTIRSPCARR